MRKAILDTDILSEIYKRRNPEIVARARRYLHFHPTLTYSSASLIEVLSGLYAKDAHRQLSDVESFLERHEQIVPEADDYVLGARIIGRLHQLGRPIGWDDPLIAACAIRRSMPLATGNVRHYRYVVDAGFPLEIENWRAP